MTVRGRARILTAAENYAWVAIPSIDTSLPTVREFGEFSLINNRPRRYFAECKVFFGDHVIQSRNYIKVTEHVFQSQVKLPWLDLLDALRADVKKACGASTIPFVIHAKIWANNPYTKGG